MFAGFAWRSLLLVLIAGLVTACAAPPPLPTQVTAPPEALAQQQRASLLWQQQQWSFSAQIAVFDLVADDRHAAYIEWRQQPNRSFLRFYHPLRGTLAELNVSPTEAVLIDADGNERRALSAETLLRQQLGLNIPLRLLQAVVIGKLPERAGMIEYYQDGTVATYAVPATRQLWQVNLSRYQAVNRTHSKLTNGDSAAPTAFQLPNAISLESEAYRLKLAVSNWQLPALASLESVAQ